MDFKKLIKYKVMSQLKPQKRNIAPSGHILIKKSLYERFTEYGVTGRYTYNEEVMEYLGLEKKRYTGASQYTFFKKETFQIRVSKEKKSPLSRSSPYRKVDPERLFYCIDLFDATIKIKKLITPRPFSRPA